LLDSESSLSDDVSLEVLLVSELSLDEDDTEDEISIPIALNSSISSSLVYLVCTILLLSPSVMFGPGGALSLVNYPFKAGS